MDKSYSSKEIALILSVSDKSVRRYLNSYFSMENGAYKVSEKMLNILQSEYLESKSDTIVQEFTQEEYEEFSKRLVEYSFLKEQLEYHRKSIDSHNRQMELLLLSVSNRKFIEE